MVMYKESDLCAHLIGAVLTDMVVMVVLIVWYGMVSSSCFFVNWAAVATVDFLKIFDFARKLYAMRHTVYR
jgi:hypothetical protein